MKCPCCKREGYTPPGVYPCGEHASHTPIINSVAVDNRYAYCRNGFVKAGEKRPPRKGEWYLSGAVPTAYRAPNDLNTPYIILKPFTGAT